MNGKTVELDWRRMEYFGVASFEKQKWLDTQSKIAGLPWRVNIDEGIIRFGDKYAYPFQVIGDYDKNLGTWMWAWANEGMGFPEQVVGLVNMIHEKIDDELFQTPEFPIDEDDLHYLGLVITGMVNATAYYICRNDNIAMLITIGDNALNAERAQDYQMIGTTFAEFIGIGFPINHRTTFMQYLRGKNCTISANDKDGANYRMKNATGPEERAAFKAMMDKDGKRFIDTTLIKGVNEKETVIARFENESGRLIEIRSELNADLRAEGVVNAAPDAGKIRAANNQKIEAAGGYFNKNLSFIGYDVTMRGVNALAGRLYVLNYLFDVQMMYKDGQDIRPIVLRDIQDNSLASYLEPDEREMLEKDKPEEQDIINLYWKIENIYALVWALGLVDDLPLNEEADNPDGTWYDAMPKPDEKLPDFIARTKMRSKKEIYAMLDLYFAYHWFVVDCRCNGKEANAIIGNDCVEDFVPERRKALEWVFDADFDWDDSLDT